MRIYNNMMVSFQRRIGEKQIGAIQRDGKAQESVSKARYNKSEDNIKSPTERLLSTYFDLEA